MTGSMRLGEVAVADVIAKLKAGMAARVAAINLEKADDIVLQAPANESYFEGRMNVLPNVPAIFVLEGKGRFSDEGSHSLIFNPTIRVCIVEADVTGPRLAKRLQRQARAITEVLFDDAPVEATTNCFQVTPLAMIPGRTFEQTEPLGGWRSYYEVEFLVRLTEL